MMLLLSVITSNTWLTRFHKFSTLPRVFSTSSTFFTSVSSCKTSDTDLGCNDFLPWLEQKSGTEISSVLSIGRSPRGRTLYASKNIEPGDRLFKVPFSVQLAPTSLPLEISCLLGDEINNIAKLALLLLYEQRLGKLSEWAPYVSRLPHLEDLNSTIFWSCDELEMIRVSPLYEETLSQKARIERDFFSVHLAFDAFADRFQGVMLQEFTYAFGLVTSRAWHSPEGISLIPFADFVNHDGSSGTYLLCDEINQHSEAIADRSFALGDEVLIRYGRFSNGTLLLDFGFTVARNTFDEVQLKLHIPQHDKLYAQKLKLLQRCSTRSIKEEINVYASSWNTFILREVRCGNRKGKGIPQSLRAFARILSCNSQEELDDFVSIADKTDGRLARYPLKNDNEIAAHQFLQYKILQLIDERDKHINLLEVMSSHLSGQNALRRRLAEDLLNGELRILKSAFSWLRNYCSTLMDKSNAYSLSQTPFIPKI